MSEPIVVYTSTFCPHSWSVERFLRSNDVPIKLVNIDKDPQARQEVMALNRGFASVPTLIFPDGSQLTEPSLGQIRAKLGMESPSLIERVNRIFGK